MIEAFTLKKGSYKYQVTKQIANAISQPHIDTKQLFKICSATYQAFSYITIA